MGYLLPNFGFDHVVCGCIPEAGILVVPVEKVSSQNANRGTKEYAVDELWLPRRVVVRLNWGRAISTDLCSKGKGET